jgi:apolipoprotein N-acyltransferase
MYASMRAIETRKPIARAANTGISCFINAKGEISQATAYWTPDVIRETILFNDVQTFYVQHGDYIGRTAGLLSIFLFLLTVVRKGTGGRLNYRGMK